MSAPVTKAIFPVGGLGTRFLPATKAMPKEMLPVVDKPLIQYAVEEAQAAGITEFIFVTGRGKQAIEDHFDQSWELRHTLKAAGKIDILETLDSWVPPPGRVAYTRQQAPLGLGHAVWCARNLVGDEPFAVLLADDLVMAEPGCVSQMMDVRTKHGGNVLAVMDVLPEHTSRYGILETSGNGGGEGETVEIRGMVEKPDPADAPSTLAIIGRYILEPSVFGHLERREQGAGGEIQLTDSLARMIGEGPFHGLRFKGRRFDCGSKAGFLEAQVAFALERGDLRDDMAAILAKYAG